MEEGKRVVASGESGGAHDERVLDGPLLYRLSGDEAQRDDWELALEHAARYLRQGGLVAFPTETVYGLGADALQPEAVRRIFAVKGRPADNPLIVHIAHAAQLETLVRRVPQGARALMKAFWPGPLTLVLDRAAAVPDVVTAGLATVAVRMPDHALALELIERCGRPVAAPSANPSGRPSPTTGADVAAEFRQDPLIILDAGATAVGVESTVVDLTVTPPVILRPGAVTAAELGPVWGGSMDDGAFREPAAGEPVRSPGLRYRHYAPNPPLVLVHGASPAQRRRRVLREAQRRIAQGERLGILCCEENRRAYQLAGSVVSWGPAGRPEAAARRLYASLRRLEKFGVDVILAESVGEQGIGRAVMNRLKKAASAELPAGPAHASDGRGPHRL